MTRMPYSWDALEPDYDNLERITQFGTFSLVIDGSSLILFPPDFKKLRTAAGDLPLWYDAAHVLGLITGNRFPNPLRYGIDVISGSTQKTLLGPVGGLIATNSENIYSRVAVCTSNDMATPDYFRYASLVRVLINWQRGGEKLAERIVSNARQLAGDLAAEGFTVLLEDRGYTSTHQVAFVAPEGYSASRACKVLDSANIITTPFPLPNGNEKSEVIRIGTTEITQQGAEKDDMKDVASAIKNAFLDVDRAKKSAAELMRHLRTHGRE